VAERRTHPNGGVYERGPDGQWHLVSAAPTPAIGPAIGNDPRIPGQLQSQQLQAQRTRQEIAKNPLDVANARTNIEQGRNSIRQTQIGNVQELRKEFNALPEVKLYGDSLAALSGMMRAPKGPQGDLAVIYGFAKAMDPGSVVREGEMNMANSTASIVDQMKVKYKSFAEGKGLPPEVRTGLIEAARAKTLGMRDGYTHRYQQYREQAHQMGIPAHQVVGNFLADAVRPVEEQYIQQHGGTPRNQQGNQAAPSFDVAAPGSKFRTENNPERSAFIDQMVRQGVPFDQAQAQYRQRFPGAPLFDNPAKWEQALDFARKHPEAAGSFGQSMDTVPMDQTEQDRNWLGQTAPGQAATLFGNALTGGIPSALAGEEGQMAIGNAREGLGGWSLAPEAAGAIGATLAGTRALGAIPALASRPGAAMLGADAAYGGLYGGTQNPDNPVGGAVLGAGAGVLGNQIGSRVLAPGLRAGGAAIGINPAPKLPRGQDLIATQTNKADPSAVMGQLQSAADLNMPFALVDAAPQLRALGGSVTRKSPEAFALANEQLGSRTLGQVDRLTGIVEQEMGPRINLPTFKEGVKKSAQAKSRPLYESAKGQSPVDDPMVNEMLQTPAGQRAARSGYDEAINNGEPVGDLVEEVDSITGQVRLAGRPSWHVLQRMKFALDDMPDQTNLARRFNGQLGKLNPDFRKANLEYAKEMRRGDIAESGYGSASPNVRPPELGASMASPTNMKDPGLFKQGYGSNLIDKARGMRDSANPYEVASMASPDQLAKMQAVSPGLHGKFGQARAVEGQMSQTNKELFGGSPTASRMEADKLFEGGALEGAMDLGLSVASGTPPINAMRAGLFAGRSGFSGLKDAYNLGIGKSAQQRALEMAPSLFNPDPHATMAALGELMKQRAAREAYVQRTGMFGAGIGAPLAITAYGN
jgi:hypothetical protein